MPPVHEHRWSICWLNDYDPLTETVTAWCHCGRVEEGIPVDRFQFRYAPNGLTRIEHEYMQMVKQMPHWNRQPDRSGSE